MECEEAERGEEDDSEPDPFIAEGLSSSDDESDGDLPAVAHGPIRGRDNEGKRFREALKAKLFRAKERRRGRRNARLVEIL
jgi:hypothetical protein